MLDMLQTHKGTLLILGPFVAFFIGTFIAHWLKLHSVRLRDQFLMGIPVSLVLVSLLIDGAHSQVSATSNGVQVLRDVYGYEKPVTDLLCFLGVVTFLGTGTPLLFEKIRAKIIEKATQEIGDDDTPAGPA